MTSRFTQLLSLSEKVAGCSFDAQFHGQLGAPGKINRQLIFEAGLPPPSSQAPFFAESEYLGILSPPEERARRKIISKATRKKREVEA